MKPVLMTLFKDALIRFTLSMGTFRKQIIVQLKKFNKLFYIPTQDNMTISFSFLQCNPEKPVSNTVYHTPNTALWISTERKETIDSGISGAEAQINPLHRIFSPNSSDALISSSLLSISLHCEGAVSIMPQVHIKEMGTGWYLQLSLLTQPWATRC